MSTVYAPTLLEPSQASNKAPGTVVFTLIARNSDPTKLMDRVWIKRRQLPSGSDQWWDGTAWGTPESTEFVVLGSPVRNGQIVTVSTTGSFDTGEVWQWSARFQEVSGGGVGAYSTSQVFYTRTPPVIAAVTLDDYTPNVSRPPVYFDFEDLYASLRSYRARMFDVSTLTPPNPYSGMSEIGSTANGTPGTTTVVTAVQACPAGEVMVAGIACDNAGTSGAAPVVTIADSKGNVWTQAGSILNDPGLVNEGVVTYLWTCKPTNAIAVSDTITVTWSVSVTAKVVQVIRLHGLRLVPIAVMTNTGTSTAPTVGPITPELVGQLVIGMVGVEGPTADAFTADADTTGGSWVAFFRTGTGAADTGITLNWSSKVLSSAVAQTFNPTLGTSRDWAALAVVMDYNIDDVEGSEAVADTGDVYDSSGYVVILDHDLQPGVTYKTYVKATNTAGVETGWTSSNIYTLSAALPAAPTMTLTERPDLGYMEIFVKAGFNLLTNNQSGVDQGTTDGWAALADLLLTPQSFAWETEPYAMQVTISGALYSWVEANFASYTAWAAAFPTNQSAAMYESPIPT